MTLNEIETLREEVSSLLALVSEHLPLNTTTFEEMAKMKAEMEGLACGVSSLLKTMADRLNGIDDRIDAVTSLLHCQIERTTEMVNLVAGIAAPGEVETHGGN